MYRFEKPLIEGTLIRRQRRFVADIKLKTGEEVSVHCANAGSLEGISEPGNKVLVSEQSNPRIKFKHQLEIIYTGRTPVAIHAGRPAAVVAEAIMKGRVIELAGYAKLRRDMRKSRSCRIDFVAQGNAMRPCYIRAENVTLAKESVAYYPDVPLAEEGAGMLEELTNLVREGNRVLYMFIAQRADVNSFRLADYIDAEYCEMFRDTAARGVETTCYRAKVTRKGIQLEDQLPVKLDPK